MAPTCSALFPGSRLWAAPVSFHGHFRQVFGGSSSGDLGDGEDLREGLRQQPPDHEDTAPASSSPSRCAPAPLLCPTREAPSCPGEAHTLPQALQAFPGSIRRAGREPEGEVGTQSYPYSISAPGPNTIRGGSKGPSLSGLNPRGTFPLDPALCPAVPIM